MSDWEGRRQRMLTCNEEQLACAIRRSWTLSGMLLKPKLGGPIPTITEQSVESFISSVLTDIQCILHEDAQRSSAPWPSSERPSMSPPGPT